MQGNITVTVGVIMSTPESNQYTEGYHEYTGGMPYLCGRSLLKPTNFHGNLGALNIPLCTNGIH